MVQAVKQIDHLYRMWTEFNELYFDNQLQPVKLLIKKSRHKDGWYSYRCHKKDERPIRNELKRAAIVISERLYEPPDWGLIYGTLIHEMIHQYQAEVLNETTDHGPIFTKMAEELESTTDYWIK
jgi:hypothetical protein